MGMRVAVIGATGNAGTSVVRALAADPEIESVLGIARRRPRTPIAGVEWQTADVLGPDLPRLLTGADAVVHLAWLIQPSRDEAAMRAVNVDGSARVFTAAADAGADALVYASSVGAYSEGPKDRAVDESWPTEGIETSYYSRHKAAVERLLDAHQREHPGMRVVRLRPGLKFKREAATQIRRLFLGPLMPNRLLSRRLLAAVPAIDRLRFQVVHTDDVAEAYRLAVVGDAAGAFNIAADPVIDPPRLAEALDARPVEVPPAALRGAAALSWRARLQPTHEGWLDMALAVPVMDTTRAREELGWSARRSSVDALLELLDGLREGAGYPTPPLDPASSGRFRIGEFRTGVGARAL